MDHPRAHVSKRLRSHRPKAVRFTPGSKALGGDWSQRQGQPLSTLQPTSLANAFSQEVVQEEVVQERTTSLVERDATPSPEVDEPRATGAVAGTPLLSTALQLLPRTPHFAAIARAAAGSGLEDSDLPQLACSEVLSEPPSETESPLQRIRKAASCVLKQMHELDAATSKIAPPPQAQGGTARQGTAVAAPQVSTGGDNAALPEHTEADDGPSRAEASSAALPSCAAHSTDDASPSGGESTPPVHAYSPTHGYSLTHGRRPVHSANGSVVPAQARSMPLEGRRPGAVEVEVEVPTSKEE